MAGGAIVHQGGEMKHYAGKVTSFVVFTCIMAAFGGLIFGYDIGVSGGVTSMDVFLKTFFPSVFAKQQLDASHENQYCKFDSQLLTLFTSSLYVAGLVASFTASAVTRVSGRKASMIFGGLTFLVGAAINGAAQNVAMLIIGRLLLGVGVGFANQVLVGIVLGKTFGVSGTGHLAKGTADFVLFLICAYVAAFAWSWGPLGWENPQMQTIPKSPCLTSIVTGTDSASQIS
ncbi:hypothetical protein EJ110_NYTH47962 [Nymphaea thermarum]|nr:hypothetical protein EJ110_NYTH47962 [Nymphaea thermarum]